MKRFFANTATVLAVALLGLLCSSILAHAAGAPRLLDYQGRLTDKSGNPKPGPVTLTFRIWYAEENGSQLWSETHSNVVLTNGSFSELLGGTTSLQGILDGSPTDGFGPERFLEIRVNDGISTETLAPRRRLVSAPYAVSSEDIGARLSLPTTGQPIQNATLTPLAWANELWDEGGLHPDAGNSPNLVAPQKGKYMIFAYINWQYQGVGTRYVELRLNSGRALAAQSIVESGNQLSSHVSVSTIAELNANDIVTCVVYHNFGSAIKVLGSSDNGTVQLASSEFGMMKIP